MNQNNIQKHSNTQKHSKIEVLEIQKKLFRSKPYKIAFRINLLEPTTKQIKEMLFCLIDSLNLKDRENIENLRGRPVESFPSRGINLALTGEEIVNIFGKAAFPNQNQCESDQSQEFCYSLSTIFSKYSDDGKIIHSLKGKALGVLNEFENILNIERVCSWMPLKINGFRFGAESYAQFFLGSMLGAVPTIANRFYIEADQQSAWILVESNGSKDIFSNSFFTRLDDFLDRADLFKGLLGTLKKQYG